MRNVVRKADIVLGIALVILCAAACWYAYSSGSSGTFVTVTVNGDEYGTYPLDRDDTVDIDTEYGHNTLLIKDGKALMTEASCPDGYCLGQYKQSGGIDASNQTIVCLPNRVAVSVKSDGARGEAEGGNGNGAPDAVSGRAQGQASGQESGKIFKSASDQESDQIPDRTSVKTCDRSSGDDSTFKARKGGAADAQNRK